MSLCKVARHSLGCGAAALVSAALAQTPPSYRLAETMPADRVVDSYAVYQQLLNDSHEQTAAPPTQWLLLDTTTAKAMNELCNGPEPDDLAHAASVPAERQQDWDDLLVDYTDHCHERYRLDAALFSLKLPVRLLDDDDEARYERGLNRHGNIANNLPSSIMPQEFEGATCLHSFSAVYFNPGHTIAATYFMHCEVFQGSAYGVWAWKVLEKTPTGWKILPWINIAKGRGSS